MTTGRRGEAASGGALVTRRRSREQARSSDAPIPQPVLDGDQTDAPEVCLRHLLGYRGIAHSGEHVAECHSDLVRIPTTYRFAHSVLNQVKE